MTVRLVGLMSTVLLLSLAVFGLLMHHYQDQVMDELTRTVSTVGRAALNTFVGPDAGVPERGVRRWVERRELRGAQGRVEELETRVVTDGPGDGEPPQDAPGPVPTSGPRVLIVTGNRSDTATGDAEVEAATGRTDLRPARSGEARAVGPGSSDSAPDPRVERWNVEDPDRSDYRWTYTIRVDEVRAEEDPARGIVLRIPTLVASGDHDAIGFIDPGTESAADVRILEFGGSVEDLPTRPEAGPSGVLQAGGVGHVRDIVLPIPTRDYETLFSRFERRSLFLFLGVMILGTMTTVGIATRFTRPIRRLDRGIRRIATGDLDTTVEVHGKDEIARLGRTFNEMVRRLRAARERDRELTRREKLSALGRLAAGVAHDVRNPLHSIGLTLQHLQETGRPDGEDKRAEFDRSVAIIRDEIRRLDGLVGNFLRFARNDGRLRQPTDLGQLLRETATLVAKEAEWRRVEIALEIEEPMPPVAVDVESVRSSVLNVVLNGFEAMPEGGTVTLSAGASGGEVRLSVADTGVGIPEADREKVFDFAYTTREGGHGMGLAMVHLCVVEQHGGRVSLDSEDGAGTRVTLAFPAAVAS